jgi:hypothetical protein
VSETIVPRNDDGSWTLYDKDGDKVTLTFPASPKANFKVVTKDVPDGLPSGYTWLLNFGIKNPGGNFLPSASYHLDATGSKSWFIYYKKENEDKAKVHPLKGNHTSPGDPPIGTG